MKRKPLTRIVTFLGALCILSGCEGYKKKDAPEEPLNILWINADDLGRELACYGNPDVKTPNLDQLAREGVLYANAYAASPTCSPSRTSLITGVYPTAVRGLNHRTMEKPPLPEGIVPITELFQQAGYFCTNGKAINLSKKGKEDFNFQTENLFDGTDWRQRAEGQPFFAQVQIKEPHRTFTHDLTNPIDPETVTLPACYPDHPLLKADWAWYLESVQKCDALLGKILDRLEKDGLADRTVVFFFGDHGRPHVRDKQFLYEGGVQIPLIVRYPKHLSPNTKRDELVSLVDVVATSLDIANIPLPDYLDGQVFIGEKAKKREYVFGFRQRTGDAVEDMRSISDGQYKLIWNRTPDRPWMQLSSYKKLQYPAFTLYRVLHKQGKLGAPYNQFMAATKPEIELYDLKSDPSEYHNLAQKEAHQELKNELFDALKTNLSVFEKNWKDESEAARKKGIEGSENYYQKAIKTRRPGLSPDATDEEILKYWEDLLLTKENILTK
ncbi:MAG: sulfatase [Bacteroidota bacterium]